MLRLKPLWTSASGRKLIANGRTNSTVESRRSTATDAIFPEGLNRAHSDGFVAGESHEVVAKYIENLLARVEEFWPGTICTRNYGHRCKSILFFWSE
jgi:hypothetical protein